jgi:hypothetical protein
VDVGEKHVDWTTMTMSIPRITAVVLEVCRRTNPTDIRAIKQHERANSFIATTVEIITIITNNLISPKIPVVKTTTHGTKYLVKHPCSTRCFP